MKKKILWLLLPAVLAVSGFFLASCARNTNPLGPRIDTFHETYPVYTIGPVRNIIDFDGTLAYHSDIAATIQLKTYPSLGAHSLVLQEGEPMDDGTTNRYVGLFWHYSGFLDQYMWLSIDFLFSSGAANFYKYGNAFTFRAKTSGDPDMTKAKVLIIFSGADDVKSIQDQGGDVSLEVPLSKQWITYTIPLSDFLPGIREPAVFSNLEGMRFYPNTTAYAEAGGVIYLDEIGVVDYYEKK